MAQTEGRSFTQAQNSSEFQEGTLSEPALLSLAEAAQREGNLSEAERLWAEFQRNFPDNLEGYTGLVEVLNRLHRTEEAEEKLQLSEQKFPDHAWPLVQRAWSTFDSRDWTNAERLFGMVRERFPSDWGGYVGCAAVFRETGRLLQAQELLVEGTESVPRTCWDRDRAGKAGPTAQQLAGSRFSLAATRETSS